MRNTQRDNFNNFIQCCIVPYYAMTLWFQCSGISTSRLCFDWGESPSIFGRLLHEMWWFCVLQC